MKDHLIYIFTTYNKEGEISISQVYALTFYIAWDVILKLNGYMGIIELVGMEETCMPVHWDDEPNLIGKSRYKLFAN